MYSAGQRKLAIETYIKFHPSAVDTVAELGYPTRHSLTAWYKDYLEHGDPKTPKSKRVIAMPRFYAEEMEAFLSGPGLDPNERIIPVTKHFLNHAMARVYRELRRIWSADEIDEELAWTIDFLAREFSAMRGGEEPSDVEREDALIFGMSRR